MTFFFRSLPISCEIITFSLELYVTSKGSLCGASLRNSSFSLCLTMSNVYTCLRLSFSNSPGSVLCFLPENYHSYLQISLLHFVISCVCPWPGFLILVLEFLFVFLPLLWLLLEGGFCRNSS